MADLTDYIYIYIYIIYITHTHTHTHTQIPSSTSGKLWDFFEFIPSICQKTHTKIWMNKKKNLKKAEEKCVLFNQTFERETVAYIYIIYSPPQKKKKKKKKNGHIRINLFPFCYKSMLK